MTGSVGSVHLSPASVSMKPLSFDPILGAEGHPMLKCPFECHINPNQAHAEDYCIRRAIALGIIPDTPKSRAKFRAGGLGTLAARMYPFVTAEQLEIVSDCILVLFVFDDLCDKITAQDDKFEERIKVVEERMIDICKGSALRDDDHPLGVCLSEILERVRRSYVGSWVDQFAADVENYFRGVRQERTLRSKKEEPMKVPMFKALRRLTVGTYPGVDILGMFLPNRSGLESFKSHIMQNLIQMAVNYAAWSNDIYSLNKEVDEGASGNLVYVLAAERDIALSKAVDRVISMCNDEITCFAKAAEEMQMKCNGDEDVDIFVNGLKHIMRGNLDWSRQTERYGV